MLTPEGRRYSKTDLLNIATKLESAMKNYFTALAEKFPAKRELFIAFAEEEDEHIGLVSSLSNVGENNNEEENIRIAEVMNVFEQNEVLHQAAEGTKKVNELRNVGEAMSLSSELKRIVELFYCQIAGSFEPEDRKILYNLIVEEHQHRVQVEEMADSATGEVEA